MDEDNSRLLWEALTERNFYTKSYDDFVSQFSTPEKRRKLYNGLKERGLYTKPEQEFMSQFFQKKSPVKTEASPQDSVRLSQESVPGSPPADVPTAVSVFSTPEQKSVLEKADAAFRNLPQIMERMMQDAESNAERKRELENRAKELGHSWSAGAKESAPLPGPSYSTTQPTEKFMADVRAEEKIKKENDALARVRDKRKGNYELTGDHIQFRAEGEPGYLRQQLSRRTPMEKMLYELRQEPGQHTVARYDYELSALQTDIADLEGGVTAITREIEETLGKNAFGQYTNTVLDLKALAKKMDAMAEVMKNPKPEDIEKYNAVAGEYNAKVEMVRQFQEHPLVVERDAMIGALEKNFKRATGLLSEDRYKIVRELAELGDNVQAYEDKQSVELKGAKKADYFADGIILKSVAKLPAALGAFMDIAESMIVGDKEYTKWDAIEDWLRDVEKDANRVWPSPSKWARPMLTKTADWNNHQVDFDEDGNIQAVRDEHGNAVQAMLSPSQTEEIKKLPRREQYNMSGIPYKASGVMADLLFQIGGTKAVAGGLTSLGMAAKPAAMAGVTASTLGTMVNPLYNEGLQLFDGDKVKAGRYALGVGTAIGFSANLFGLESKLATGQGGFLDDIFKTSASAQARIAAGKMGVGEAIAHRGRAILMGGAGEMIEEVPVEMAIDNAVRYFMAAQPTDFDRGEIMETSLISFIVGSLGNVPNSGLNDIQKASLLAATKNPDAYIAELRRQLANGMISIPVDGHENIEAAHEAFVQKQQRRIERLQGGLEVVKNKMKDVDPVEVVDILDKRIEALETMERAKAAKMDAIADEAKGDIEVIDSAIAKGELPKTPEITPKEDIEPTPEEDIESVPEEAAPVPTAESESRRIADAVGKRVVVNGRAGRLQISDDGAFVVDMGDVEYEIPNVNKDPDTDIGELGMRVFPERAITVKSPTEFDIDGETYAYVSGDENQVQLLAQGQTEPITIKDKVLARQIQEQRSKIENYTTPEEALPDFEAEMAEQGVDIGSVNAVLAEEVPESVGKVLNDIALENPVAALESLTQDELIEVELWAEDKMRALQEVTGAKPVIDNLNQIRKHAKTIREGVDQPVQPQQSQPQAPSQVQIRPQEPAEAGTAEAGTAEAVRAGIKENLQAIAGELGYVPYEQAIEITPTIEFEGLPEDVDEATMEARTRMTREQETTPPTFVDHPIGTRAIDRFGEVYELKEVPIDELVVVDDGGQMPETVDKYADWLGQGNKMPPVRGVENFEVHGGKVKITDGRHRIAAAKKAGLDKVPVWVALTNPQRTTRPIYAVDEIYDAYIQAKELGINQKLADVIDTMLGIEPEPLTGPDRPLDKMPSKSSLLKEARALNAPVKNTNESRTAQEWVRIAKFFANEYDGTEAALEDYIDAYYNAVNAIAEAETSVEPEPPRRVTRQDAIEAAFNLPLPNRATDAELKEALMIEDEFEVGDWKITRSIVEGQPHLKIDGPETLELSGKELLKQVRKTKKIGRPVSERPDSVRGIAQRLREESVEDEIAVAFAEGMRIAEEDVNRWGDPNWIKDNPAIRFHFTRKRARGGKNVDQWAKTMADRWGLDEQVVIQKIMDFISSTEGTGDYLRRRINEQGQGHLSDPAFEGLNPEELADIENDAADALEFVESSAGTAIDGLTDEEVEEFNTWVEASMDEDGNVDWNDLLNSLPPEESGEVIPKRIYDAIVNAAELAGPKKGEEIPGKVVDETTLQKPGQKETEEVQVTVFRRGAGGTAGILIDESGRLYKSLERHAPQQTDEGFKRMPTGEISEEHEILSELAGYPHVPKVGNVVKTSEGLAFEIEQLYEVDHFSLEERYEIEAILDYLNDYGVYVNDIVTVMKRADGTLVVVDFSHAVRNKDPRLKSMYSDLTGGLTEVKEKMHPNDKLVADYRREITNLWEAVEGYEYRVVLWEEPEGFSSERQEGGDRFVEYPRPLTQREVDNMGLEFAGRTKNLWDAQGALVYDSKTGEYTDAAPEKLSGKAKKPGIPTEPDAVTSEVTPAAPSEVTPEITSTPQPAPAAPVEPETQKTITDERTEQRQPRQPDADTGRPDISAGVRSRGPGGRPSVRVAGEGNIPTPRENVGVDSYQGGLDDAQRLGVNLAIDRFDKGEGGFLLADGTGFGKTRQILAIADQHRKKFGKPVLIVTQNKQIIAGSFTSDAEAMGIDLNDFEVVTYTDLAKKKAGLDDYGLVIFDEAHNLKNSDTQKSIAGGKVMARNTVYATATPMDRPSAATYFLASLFGQDVNDIADEIGIMKVPVKDERGFVVREVWQLQEGMDWGKVVDNIHNLRNRAIEQGLMVRRELPFWGEIKDTSTHMSEEQRSIQEEVDEYWTDKIEDAKAEGRPKLAKNLAGQRILALSRLSESMKIDHVWNEIEKAIEAGESIILIAEGVNDTMAMPHMEIPAMLGTIAKRLADKGVKFAKVYGSGNKSAEVEAFQSGKVNILLATPQSGGTGINLDDRIGDRPRRMIVATANFSGDVFDQIMGRVSRKTSKSPSTVEFLTFSESLSDARRKEILSKKLQALRGIQGTGDVDAFFETEQPTPGAAPSQQGQPRPEVKRGSPVPPLDWQPYTTKRGNKKYTADATPDFWDWWNANGKKENSEGISVTRDGKYGKWRVWRNPFPFEGIQDFVERVEAAAITEQQAPQTMEQVEQQAPVAPEFVPTKSTKTKYLEEQLEKAIAEVSAADTALKSKRKELDKTIMEDQSDLFGNRKSSGGLFDERVDTSARKKVLDPYERRFQNAQARVKAIEHQLEVSRSESEQTLFGDVKEAGFSLPKKIRNWAEKFFRETFTAKGELNETVFDINIRRMSHINATLRRAESLDKRLKTEVKKFLGRNPTPEQLEDLHEALQNPNLMTGPVSMRNGTPIPSSLRSVLRDMRTMVDTLSTQLIAEGIASGKMEVKINDNLGMYLTRAYRVHKDKDWAEKVRKTPVFDRAVNWFHRHVSATIQHLEDVKLEYENRRQAAIARANKAKPGTKAVAQAQKAAMFWQGKMDGVDAAIARMMRRDANAEAEVMAILEEQQPVSDVAVRGKLGTKDLGIFKQRQRIPKEIRDLFGEYLDPSSSFLQSVYKMTHLLENGKFLAAVEQAGEGVFLFRDPVGDHTVKISAEGSRTFSPLSGYYTTKELARAFEDFNKPDQIPDWMQPLVFLASVAKWTKTVGSIATQVKNFTSNFFFHVANGHFPDMEAWRYGMALARADVDFISKTMKNKADAEEEIARLVELGIFYDAGSSTEIDALMKDVENWYETTAVFSEKAFGRVAETARDVARAANQLYRVGDNAHKAMAYVMERKRYARAMFGKNWNDLTISEKDAVDAEVAPIIRNQMPTYSLVSKNVQRLRRIPFAGTFVSFPYESIRVTRNTVLQAIKEWEDPKTRHIAIKRGIGLASAYTATTAISHALLSYFGFSDDDDRDNLKYALPPWSEQAQIIPVKRVGTEMHYIDPTTNLPQAYHVNVLTSLLDGRKDVDEKIKAASWQLLEPFLGQDMTWQKLAEAIKGETNTGIKIYVDDDPDGKKINNAIAHVSDALVPGTAISLTRVYKSMTNPEREYGGKLYPGIEIGSMFGGVRVSTIDFERGFFFSSKRYGNRRSEDIGIYRREEKKTIYDDMDPAEKEARLQPYRDRANAAYQKMLQDLIRDYGWRVKQGADPEFLQGQLRLSGFRKSEIQAIVEGRMIEAPLEPAQRGNPKTRKKK